MNRDISEDLFVLIEMKDLKAHEAIHIDDIDGPYATNDGLKRLIMEHGL